MHYRSLLQGLANYSVNRVLKRALVGFVAFEAILVAGCATGSGASAKNSAESKRIHALEMKIKNQRSILQDLRERNMVLEKRDHLRAVNQIVSESEEMGESIGEPIVQSEPPAILPKSFLAGSSVVTQKNLPVKLPIKSSQKQSPHLAFVPAPILGGALAPNPIAVSSEKTGEHYLYSKILETYRTSKSDEMKKAVELLLKSYPESVFADNAIYLSGLLAFERGDFTSALNQFDKLLRDYPRSNKAVAALYARASIEKRSGHIGNAKRGFLQVRDLYPGSPEAARVSVELKLLESAAQKHRES